MSIINDALKKTQNSLKKPKKTPESDPVAENADDKSPKDPVAQTETIVQNDSNDQATANAANEQVQEIKESVQKEQVAQETVNIYEKMLQERQAKVQAQAASPKFHQTSTLSPSSSASVQSNKWLISLFTFTFVLAALVASIIFIARSQPVKDFFRSAGGNGNGSNVRIKTIQPRTYNAGELVLNGTSLIDGRNVALINDEIYEIGDMIDGKRVTSIIPNQVELRDDQKIITIKVR